MPGKDEVDKAAWDQYLGQNGIYTGSVVNQYALEEHDRAKREREKYLNDMDMRRHQRGTQSGSGSGPVSNLVVLAALAVGVSAWYYAALLWGFNIKAVVAGVSAGMVSKYIFSTEPFLFVFDILARILRFCLILAMGALIFFFVRAFA